jgi:hypothetical protein
LVAAAFDAHILGVVFAYVPSIRRSVVAHTTAAPLLEAQRQTSEAAAQAAAGVGSRSQHRRHLEARRRRASRRMMITIAAR